MVQVCAVIVSGELEDTVAEVMIITQSGTALDSGIIQVYWMCLDSEQ